MPGDGESNADASVSSGRAGGQESEDESDNGFLLGDQNDLLPNFAEIEREFKEKIDRSKSHWVDMKSQFDGIRSGDPATIFEIVQNIEDSDTF